MFIVVCLPVALAVAGAIQSKQLPDAGVQWLQGSPGHAALGDVLRIAPAHRRGHRNGPRRRYICSPPPPISFAVVVAKRPCYGPFKLTPSY